MMEILTYPRRAIPQYWGRIPPLIAGWCVGFVAFAKGIAVCLDQSATVTVWLFIGLIVARFRPCSGSGKGRPHTRSVGESAG